MFVYLIQNANDYSFSVIKTFIVIVLKNGLQKYTE